ncbi:hypothetical protein HN51_007160, partial [Arachis hypogaea]
MKAGIQSEGRQACVSTHVRIVDLIKQTLKLLTPFVLHVYCIQLCESDIEAVEGINFSVSEVKSNYK